MESIFEKESVSFSGKLIARGMYFVNRDWLFDEGDFADNRLLNYSEADFLIDVRLKNGMKGFINLTAQSLAQEDKELNSLRKESDDTSNNNLEDNLKEFFIDANYRRKAYFRIGKQVLKWGRTYFWNPNDFINIEKHNFMDMYRLREGIYGSRAHFPLGSQKNIYLFMNFSSADNLDDVAFSAKYEFLINSTEIALSSWNKRGHGRALGCDFSTRIFNFDINSEISLYHKDNHYYIELNETTAVLAKEKNKNSIRLSLGITKTFDFQINDQIILTYEFFFNQAGYEENIFKNEYANFLISFYDLLDPDFYEPNYHSKFYSAVFASINKYPTPKSTVLLNILSNTSDGSFIVSPGFSYEPVDYFNILFNVNIFAGPENREYTREGFGISFDFSVELQF